MKLPKDRGPKKKLLAYLRKSIQLLGEAYAVTTEYQQSNQQSRAREAAPEPHTPPTSAGKPRSDGSSKKPR